MRQKYYVHTGHSAQYNAKGYKDLTAYYVLRNIEREEIAEALARSKTFVKNKHRSALAAARLLFRSESC
jgi:hypothetical protein